MKSTLLATAAAVGLVALPQTAFASPPDRGMFEANIGFGWTDDNFSNVPSLDDAFAYGGKTRWLLPLSEPLHIQGDLFVEQLDNVFGSNTWSGGEDDSTLFGASVHMLHPMDNGRIGVAGSLFSLDAYGPFIGKGQHSNVDYGLVALEGQYNLREWTLVAQGGWFGNVRGCDSSEGCVHNGVFFRANATYFFTQNTSLSLDGNLFWGDDEGFGDVSGGTLRLEGQYKFTDSCFAAFVALDHEEEEVDVLFASAEQDTTQLQLGIRLFLDSETGQEFSQKGPSLNTPTFHHLLTVEGALQAEAFSNAVP
jgi:hypothetical protein